MLDSGTAVPTTPQVPDHVLLRRIGQGSYGEVWLGRSVLGSYRAIKVVYRHTFTQERPFAREFFGVRNFEPVSRLHEGLVDVLQVGRNDEAGYFYYVMELGDDQERGQEICPESYVPRTLARYLARQGRASPPETLRIGCDIASALAVLHGRGLIHRDIKPANVIFIDGVAKLADIGLVAEAREGLTNVGTEGYTAPEGAGRPSADLYSLGKVLYEMVTGKDPREFPQLPADLTEMAHSAAVLELNEVLLRACETEPARRYRSAGQFESDLRLLESGFSLRARRARRRSYVAAALAAPLVLAAAIWWRLPGKLTIKATPPGALVQVGARTMEAQGRPLSLKLPASGYVVRVAAPGFEPQTNEILLARGQSRRLEIHLAHSQGMLEAAGTPSGLEISVDGSSHGSRIRGLPLDTGAHRLEAWAPGCFADWRDLTVVRGATTRTSFSLEQGERWRYSGTQIQTAKVLPDLFGDGVATVAVQELNDLVILRGEDGTNLFTFRVADNPAWQWDQVDLGGPLGRVLLTWEEQEGGISICCLQPGRTNDPVVWCWRGPAAHRKWQNPLSIGLAVAGDLNGDGVRELAVVGREAELFVLDGRTGERLREGIRVLADPGQASWAFELEVVSDPPALAFVAEDHSRPFERSTERACVAGCVRLTDGAVTCKGFDLCRCKFVRGEGQGELRVLGWDTNSWWLAQPADGQVRWQGPMPLAGRFPSEASLAGLDGDGPDLLFLYPRYGLAAVRVADGTLLWQNRDEVFGFASSPNTPVPPSAGGQLLCFGSAGLKALDPRSGRVAWTVAGTIQGILGGETDQSGRSDIIVGVGGVEDGPGGALLCVDAAGHRQWQLSLDVEVRPIGLVPDAKNGGRSGIAFCRGASVVGMAHQPNLMWSRKANGPLQSRPLIVKPRGSDRAKIIQTGAWSAGRQVVCFDARTGTECWSSRAFCAPNRAPALVDWDSDGEADMVCLRGHADAGERLDIVRAADGRTLHSIPIPPGLWGEDYSTPAAADLNGDGHLDFVSHRWRREDVLAIDGRTERVLWRFETADHNEGGVAVADLDGDGLDDVIAPSEDGCVYALRGRDGALLWESPIDGGSRSPPAVAHLTGGATPEVLIISRRGVLWVLDGGTGHVLWDTTALPEIQNATEALGHGVVLGAPDRPLILAPLGRAGLVAIDWQTRSLRWQALASEGVTATPALCELWRDGRRQAVVGTMDGQVAVLDCETGEQLWTLDLEPGEAHARTVADCGIEAEAAVADLNDDGLPDIVVASHNRTLYAVDGRAIPATPSRDNHRIAGR
jgi:outer membrane protein assembly factor BamB